MSSLSTVRLGYLAALDEPGHRAGRRSSSSLPRGCGRAVSPRVAHIPGNILQGNWTVIAFVDDGTSAEQQEALLNVLIGKLDGPLTDFAQVIGEVVAVERA